MSRIADRVDPAAVVGDLDDDLAPFVESVQQQPALGRLAACGRTAGGFDAVIDRVADHVRERIPDGLDDRLVEFRLLPVHVDR